LGAYSRQILSVSADAPADFASILFTRTRDFGFADAQGRLVTEQVRLGTSGIRVSRVRSTGHWIRLTEEQDATFLFPRRGKLALRVVGTEASVDPGEAVLVRPAGRFTRVIAPESLSFEGHVLMLPMADLRALASEVAAEAAIARDIVRLSGDRARRLMDYTDCLLADAPDGRGGSGAAPLPPSDRTLRGMASLMTDLLLDWLANAADAARGPALRGTPADARRARRAEAIMQDRFDEALTVAGLAGELGVSLRSLQLAFQTVFGECPRARLTRIRLDKARERLRLAPDDAQVTAIALDCGFTHLGRFSEVYRRTFGERPSDTLARGRAGSLAGRPRPWDAAQGAVS
jgi:AraC-like DNA-binding protein